MSNVKGIEMNYRNAFTSLALGLLLSASQAVSAKTSDAYLRTSTAILSAQDNGTQDRPNLNLTAEQQAQLKSIRQSERSQLMALRNDQTLSREQKEAKSQS